jgi:hypothetical protein
MNVQYFGMTQLKKAKFSRKNIDSPLGQETSNCSGPALNSVNGETYTPENRGRLNLPLD